MSGAYFIHERDKKCIRSLIGKSKGKRSLKKAKA
jgi:hypothetical protein